MKSFKETFEESILNKKINTPEKLIDVIWGADNRINSENFIGKFFRSLFGMNKKDLDTKYSEYSPKDIDSIVYNASKIENELENLGYSKEDIDKIRQLVIDSFADALSKIKTKYKLETEDIKIVKTSFGLFKIFKMDDDNRTNAHKEFYALTKKNIIEAIKKMN